MQKFIVGNWKMYGTTEKALSLLSGIAPAVREASVNATTTVICPPFTLLSTAKSAMKDWPAAALGAQDCHPEPSGAFTGDISAGMLVDAGCTYVILGHSERRQFHREHDTLIATKLAASVSAGLIPILCVGETLEQREAGQAETVVEQQLIAALELAIPNPLIIAYEPVWAIGTGRVAELADVSAMHRHIRECVSTKKSVELNRVAVLYGGSVKPDNAPGLFSLEEVGGVLVGGASLKAAEFSAILAAAIRG